MQGRRNQGARRGDGPLQVLADILTLFQSRGRLCPSHYYSPSPGFLDLPTSGDVLLRPSDKQYEAHS